VSPLIALFRAGLFVAAVAIVGFVLRAVYRAIVGDPTSVAGDVWWAIPTLAFAVFLYRRAGRWTGGGATRQRIRADLKRGEVAVQRIVATDAIEVEEQEDEGPAFFILTGDGTTMLFAGQYLDRLKRKGFPWTAFDIVEAPESKIFFDITSAGDRLRPSATRPPFTWDEMKSFGTNEKGNYRTVDMDFDTLARGAAS
jgi:hypothetical protein